MKNIITPANGFNINLNSGIKKPYFSDNIDRNNKTIRELTNPNEYQHTIFHHESSKLYYCHINLDLLEVVQTPPDLYGMSMEAGMNLGGLNVAMDTYIKMLNSGNLSYFVPHYYFTFNSPDKYDSTLQSMFNALSLAVSQNVISLYEAGYEISIAGGGLTMYMSLIYDLLNSVSSLQTSAITILKTLSTAKEFYFIETNLNDPTYGIQLFKNLTYMDDNTNVLDSENFYGANLNILDPLRFEKYIESYSKIYDITTDINLIYSELGISSSNTQQDTLEYILIDLDSSNSVINSVNFTFNITNNRDCNNFILKFYNKPYKNINSNVTGKIYTFIGNENISKFFQAASLFILQPVITNYLYSTYLIDTNSRTTSLKILYPSPLMYINTLKNFINYYKSSMNYGNALKSGIAALLSTKTSEIIIK